MGFLYGFCHVSPKVLERSSGAFKTLGLRHLGLLGNMFEISSFWLLLAANPRKPEAKEIP